MCRSTSLPGYAVLLTVLTVWALGSPLTATAQERAGKTADKASPLLHYQGRLTDSGGEPVADTEHTVVFRLYDQEEGGSVIWQETQNVSTSNGVFSAKLGSVNSMDGLAFDQTYYLSLEVNGGDEMAPRTELTDAPYAVRAYSVSAAGVDSTAIAQGAVTGSAISNGAVDGDAIGSGAVDAAAIADGAVASAKLEDRAVTTEKLDFGAVDSAAIDPDAVFKTLDPTLSVAPTDNFIGVNRADPVTGSDVFAVHSPVEFDDTFGGMYVSVEGAEAWPFYGYATGADNSAWHYFDPQAEEWVLEFDFLSPRHRLMATASGLLPGGDGDLQLGSSDHRWSAVYAENGTIQTSDRRLKSEIDSLGYGLAEVMRLEPVTYRWKEEATDEASGGERHLGLIAQQVEDVLAEVVERPDDDGGYLGMSYSELIPVLVRAVQEQQKIIERQREALRAQDRRMEKRVETLERRVRRLAREVEDDASGEARPVRTSSGE